MTRPAAHPQVSEPDAEERARQQSQVDVDPLDEELEGDETILRGYN